MLSSYYATMESVTIELSLRPNLPHIYISKEPEKLVIQPVLKDWKAPSLILSIGSHIKGSVETDADIFSLQDISNLLIVSGDGILC